MHVIVAMHYTIVRHCLESFCMMHDLEAQRQYPERSEGSTMWKLHSNHEYLANQI